MGSSHNSNHTGSCTKNLDALPDTKTFCRDLLRVHGSWAGIGLLHYPASSCMAIDLDQRRSCRLGHAMTRLVASAILAALLAAPSPVLAAAPSASAVKDSIKREGAKATIADLAKADERDAVSDHMDSGSSDWIALAPLLVPGSDVGSAEDLGISLAFSLPKNPEAVLAALDPANGHIIGANRVCGLPFVEDTVPDLTTYRLKAIRAVQGVTDTRLASVRAACLAALAAPG